MIGTQRTFLFLQGLSTPFFARLADALVSRGHLVERVNLSGGDRAFWPRLGSVDYRGTFPDWRTYLGSYLRERGVSDLILFGDCRPYHRVAVDLARARGIKVHVFEEGYFRPDWITLEKDGTNGHSQLPKTAEAYLAEAALLPDDEPPPPLNVSGGFARRVRWEILNQIATLLMAPLYPSYKRHRSHHPLREMCGWLSRLAKRPFERRYAERLSAYLTQAEPSYFLLPLQLETDYQIRRHSRFKSMGHVMEVVLESFARGAPKDALLLIKLHPLDNGLANFRKHARRIARKLNLGDRVLVMDGGHLPSLIARCEGVVVVNSTSGLSALHHGKPVTVLGSAIFNLEGLTFKGPLDRFWGEKQAPDAELFKAFRRVVISKAQVNGSFFTEEGLALAIHNTLDRLAVLPVDQPATQPRPEPAASPAAVKAPILVRH